MPRDPRVLMYHFFAFTPVRPDPEHLFVDVTAFEQQLAYLTDRYEPIGLDRYLDAGAAGSSGREVLVTIDDAHRSVVELAAERLAAHGVPAVVFVPAGLVGRTAAWLPGYEDESIADERQLRSLADVGIELGVHGWDHSTLRGRSRTELERQTIDAGAVVERIAGYRPRAFAYPYGLSDGPARDAVQAAGFEVAFSTVDDHGRFGVPRPGVNGSDTLRSFRLKLVPGYRRLWRLGDRLPIARRTVRRLVTVGGR